jgi:hypothetical protein
MNPDVLSAKNSRIALAALAMVSCAALSAPAAAQWGARYNVPGPEVVEEDGPAMVPPQRVMRWVARQGFGEVTRPRLDGSTYVIDGIADDGSRTRFVIDAYDGELISSRPVGRVADAAPEMGLRPPGLIPRGGPPEFGEAPVPPGVVPRRGGPEYGAVAPLPRGGPPEYGETAPRLRPTVPGAPAPAPRQAMRDEPAGAKPPAGVYGVNPGSVEGAQKPAPKAAAKPPRAASVAPAAPPAASAAPAAPASPVPSATTRRPAPVPTPEQTASAPRGPVRVIEGVTPVLPKAESTTEVRVPEPPPVTPPTTIQ